MTIPAENGRSVMLTLKGNTNLKSDNGIDNEDVAQRSNLLSELLLSLG